MSVTKEQSNDEIYMAQALKLARRGIGRVSPNPMVGAVIVKDGRVIGKGYHRYFGGDHAEIDAIKHAAEDVTGATMYVTLEPCTHYGKTPPCADAIVSNKFGRVVIGMVDLDERVSGKSLERFKQAGIRTTVGVLEEQCRALNESYLAHRTTGLPLVTLKFAQSLDGRIATATGNARWISSAASRELAHRLRARHDAILVGTGTVIGDDPDLTVRLVRGRHPIRVVLDSGLRIPHDAKVFTDQNAAKTIIVTTPKADFVKAGELAVHGIEVVTVAAGEDGKVDLRQMLKQLGKRGITSLLVEGGGTVITSFLRQGLADRFTAFVAPLFIGEGIQTVGDLGITEVDRAVRLSFERTFRCGPDLVIEGQFIKA